MIKGLKIESIDPVTAVKYSHKAAYKHNSPFLLIKELVFFTMKVRLLSIIRNPSEDIYHKPVGISLIFL